MCLEHVKTYSLISTFSSSLLSLSHSTNWNICLFVAWCCPSNFTLFYGPLEVLGKERHFFVCTTLSIFSFTMSIFFKKKTLPTFEETCWFKVTFWCDPKLEVSQLKIHLTQLNYKQTSRLLSKQMVRITFFSHDFTLFFYSAAKKKLKRG